MHNGLTVLTLGIALSGCAEVSSKPSYLGAAFALTDDPSEFADQLPAGEPPAALKHVKSNRVLGAMAFQKVTRQKVDPARLTDEQ